mmetsp:Transcript_84451/g.257866  ORF Transcript_84451/g.257866 Transcript_84451/m.257866 type:complete len:361 (+) Transcript_84451:2546-3628(+)
MREEVACVRRPRARHGHVGGVRHVAVLQLHVVGDHRAGSAMHPAIAAQLLDLPVGTPQVERANEAWVPDGLDGGAVDESDGQPAQFLLVAQGASPSGRGGHVVNVLRVNAVARDGVDHAIRHEHAGHRHGERSADGPSPAAKRVKPLVLIHAVLLGNHGINYVPEHGDGAYILGLVGQLRPKVVVLQARLSHLIKQPVADFDGPQPPGPHRQECALHGVADWAAPIARRVHVGQRLHIDPMVRGANHVYTPVVDRDRQHALDLVDRHAIIHRPTKLVERRLVHKLVLFPDDVHQILWVRVEARLARQDGLVAVRELGVRHVAPRADSVVRPPGAADRAGGAMPHARARCGVNRHGAVEAT